MPRRNDQTQGSYESPGHVRQGTSGRRAGTATQRTARNVTQGAIVTDGVTEITRVDFGSGSRLSGVNLIVTDANQRTSQRHNMDTSQDVRNRLRDYERGWLPESVEAPIRPFKWVRVVARIADRNAMGMQCFAGTYMSDTGPTSLTPGDVVIVCTESRLLHCYIFLMEGQWFSIDHLPVAWQGNWASRVADILQTWLALPRTLRIFRACNEALFTINELANEQPEFGETFDLQVIRSKYQQMIAAATAKTGSLTLQLIWQSLQNMIRELGRQTNTDRDTVINMLSTVLEEITEKDVTQRHKIVELRIEGLDQLTNAIMMIFGANIRQGSAVTMLRHAIDAVQQNSLTLQDWLNQGNAVTNAGWSKVSQQSATSGRQLTRFNLRKKAK